MIQSERDEKKQAKLKHRVFTESPKRMGPLEKLTEVATPPGSHQIGEEGHSNDISVHDQKRFDFRRSTLRSTSFEKRQRLKSFGINTSTFGLSLKPVAAKIDFKEILNDSIKKYHPKTKHGSHMIDEIKKSADMKEKLITMRKQLDENIQFNSQRFKDPNEMVKVVAEMDQLRRVQCNVQNLQIARDLRKFFLVDKLERKHIKDKRKTLLQRSAISNAWREGYLIEPLKEQREMNTIHQGAQEASDQFQKLVRRNNQKNLKAHSFEKELAKLTKHQGFGNNSLLLESTRHYKRRERGQKSSLIFCDSIHKEMVTPIAINRNKSLELLRNKAAVGLKL